MLYKFILLQFIAHLLGDFIFQSRNWAIEKSKKAFTWYHVWHALVIFVLSYLLSFNFNYGVLALVLTAFHFLIDVLKSYVQMNTDKKESFYFFWDQLTHLILIVLISLIYYCYFAIDVIYKIPLKYIVIAVAFILSAKPANILIKNIFISLDIAVPTNTGDEEDENKDLPNAGKLIGIMERFLVLALILVGQYSAVGLIIAAKSILRFKDNQKNEYILVGTLLSFGIATILGILISSIISVK